MINTAAKAIAKTAQDKWWKAASKKGIETAVKFAKSDTGKEVGRIAAAEGVRKVFDYKSRGPSLKKRLKRLAKMRKKGLLRQEEYEILRKQLIESADVEDL